MILLASLYLPLIPFPLFSVPFLFQSIFAIVVVAAVVVVFVVGKRVETTGTIPNTQRVEYH